MDEKQLLGGVRKAVEDFNLISDGDRIAVGVSGGKDSLTLLYALAKLSRFLPKKFELVAIMIDLGFEETDKERIEEIRAFAKNLGVTLHVIPTDIGKIVFDIREEKSPCSLCAKLRRGALNKAAKELNCNKVALAHSMDDFIETMLLSLVYEGRISTIPAESFLTNTELFVIRPMMYIDEKDVISFSKDFPILHNPCPADKHTRRQYVKELVAKLDEETGGGKDRMRRATIELVKENWKKSR